MVAVREVNVYDEARHPIWHSGLGPGEHAVFHVDRATGHHRTAEGMKLRDHWNRTVLVFESLDAATDYSEGAVDRVPSISCRIFAAGDAVTPVRVVTADARRAVADPAYARRRLAWGSTLITLGLVGVWIDWLYDWFYLIGVLVGVKFLTVGLVRFVEGFVELRKVRRSAGSGDV